MRGRPRDQETEDRILEVTLRLLADQGYARMSIDTVAEQAGVSKPTIYRRWANKGDLATAALSRFRLKEPQVDTGSTISDLIGILRNFRTSLMRPNGMSLIGTVLAEEAHTPELLVLFRDRLVKPRRAQLLAVLERARSRAECDPSADLNVAASAMIGAFYARYLADGRVPPGFADEVARLVWRGLARSGYDG